MTFINCRIAVVSNRTIDYLPPPVTRFTGTKRPWRRWLGLVINHEGNLQLRFWKEATLPVASYFTTRGLDVIFVNTYERRQPTLDEQFSFVDTANIDTRHRTTAEEAVPIEPRLTETSCVIEPTELNVPNEPQGEQFNEPVNQMVAITSNPQDEQTTESPATGGGGALNIMLLLLMLSTVRKVYQSE